MSLAADQPVPDSFNSEMTPLRGRWTSRFNRLMEPGDLLDVDVLVVATQDWPSRREYGDSTWRPIDFGAVVIAVKILC